ncbi:MAG: hypothetical protein JO206_07995 [Solirubrobacterales bacterium]|nr:hypothetical protein [Solirubrobacterales bacterium]MBV9472896.1 hypothetical protein [Solirubrobacterales bacterium]
MGRVRTTRELTTSGAALAEDVALAALLGGNLFGRVAMHPALVDVSDAAERGRVLNRAWRRYGTVNSLALAALVAGWLPERHRRSSARRRPSSPQRRLLIAKDVAIGAVVLTGLASAAGGVGFAQQAPHGAVPMASGHDPSPDTPARAARIKRVVNLLGGLNVFAELSLAAVNALTRA